MDIQAASVSLNMFSRRDSRTKWVAQ